MKPALNQEQVESVLVELRGFLAERLGGSEHVVLCVIMTPACPHPISISNLPEGEGSRFLGWLANSSTERVNFGEAPNE